MTRKDTSSRLAVLLPALMVFLAVPTVTYAIPISPQCFISGGGWINHSAEQSNARESDSFGGRAHSYADGRIDGRWTHTLRDGRTFHGEIDELVCRRDGGDPGHPEVLFSIGRLGGTGTFDGEPGYVFNVDVSDHGERGNDDRYHFLFSDPATEEVVYVIGGIISGGNIQIHPTNRGHP